MILPGNQAPVAMGSLGELSFDQGGEVTVHVAENFSDPDGDALTYTAASSDTAVVTVTTSEATVVVVGVAAGSATVTVTASDPGGLSATQDMAVMILPGNQATAAGRFDSGADDPGGRNDHDCRVRSLHGSGRGRVDLRSRKLGYGYRHRAGLQ